MDKKGEDAMKRTFYRNTGSIFPTEISSIKKTVKHTHHLNMT